MTQEGDTRLAAPLELAILLELLVNSTGAPLQLELRLPTTLVTRTVTVQPPVGTLILLNVMDVLPPAAVIVPLVHVPPMTDGDATRSIAGKLSTSDTSVAAFTGLLNAKVKTVNPAFGKVVGLNDLVKSAKLMTTDPLPPLLPKAR